MRSLVTSKKNYEAPSLTPRLNRRTKHKGKQMRNVMMLAAALMMGCGDEEGDTAADTAAVEDTAAE